MDHYRLKMMYYLRKHSLRTFTFHSLLPLITPVRQTQPQPADDPKIKHVDHFYVYFISLTINGLHFALVLKNV